MSCSDQRPLFFQRQPMLPLPVQRFLRVRLEAALHHSGDRALLVWPTVLGAPKLRQDHPDGLPEHLLLIHAAKMLHALGEEDPEAAWREVMARLPDTAEEGAMGWKPHRAWGQLSPLVSLRSGVALAALAEMTGDENYGLKAGVALFNSALFHETHDALEALWKDAAGELRQGLQGLILMTAGYHHMQLHNLNGMKAVWDESIARLATFNGVLDTPWGVVDHRDAVQFTEERMAYLSTPSTPSTGTGDEAIFEALWAMPVPRWEIS